MQRPGAEQSDEADDDQIDRDDVIQQFRHDQDQYACDQRDQWPNAQVQIHDNVSLGCLGARRQRVAQCLRTACLRSAQRPLERSNLGVRHVLGDAVALLDFAD